MTREEALNTLMKMRAWRKCGKEQKEEERPEMPEQKEVDEAFDVCIKLLQSSLPSNLDEAALASMPKPNGIESNTDFSFMQMVWMFEQGAKWMAKQGYKQTERVFNFNGENKPCVSPTIFLPKEFEFDEEVIVQIRKK